MRAGDTGFQVDQGAYYVYSGSAWIFSAYIDVPPTTLSSFTNSWSASQTVRYTRVGGVVFWEGRIVGGTTNPAFTIPVGFRPDIANSQQLPAITGTLTTLTRIVLNTTSVTAISGSEPNLGALSYPVAAP